MEEFTIPASLEDMSSTSMGTYMMRQAWDTRQITTAYKEWQNKAVVLEDIPDLVPLLYSSIMNISDLSEFMLTDLWRLIFKYVNKLDSALRKLSQGELPGPEERRYLATETTIIVYFFGIYIQAVDKETGKNTAAFDPTAEKQRRGRKKCPQGVGRFANWETERITALEAILQIFEAPLKEIFTNDAADQLGGATANVVYRLLENVSVCRDSECSDLCVRLLALLVTRYGHGALCPYQIPALLSTSEQIVPILARVFDEIVNRHSYVVLLSDLMRESTALSDSSSGDSLIIKNTAEFLFQLCKCIGPHLLNFLAYIDALLNSPNFSLRNASLSAMCELVKSSLTKKELSEKEAKIRDQILDEMLSHSNDVSSHVRARCLKLLNELLQSNSLPLERQPEIVSLVARRLLDTTATVRKAAVQFLMDYVDYNTFLCEMDPAKLDDIIEKKQAAVSELREEIGVDQKTTDEWDEVSGRMMAFFRKHDLPKMPKDLNDLERPKGTVQEELANVTKLLDEGKFIDAIRLVQRCSYWFQECALFTKDDADKETNGADQDDESAEEDEPEMEQSKGSESNSEEQDQESGESGDEKSRQTSKSGSKASKKAQKKVKGSTNWFTLAMKVYLREPPKKARKNQKLDEHDEMENSQEPTEQQVQSEHEILVSKLEKHEKELMTLLQLKHYLLVYSAALPQMNLMLQSKTPSDILAAIAFFVHIITADLPVGTRSISNMAHLYGHKEESVKKAVEAAFENLYLTCDSSDIRKNSVNVARKLIGLIMNCTTNEMERWGRVIADLVATKKIPSDVVMVFFEIVMQKLGPEPMLSRVTALLLIAKCSLKKPSIVQANLTTIQELMSEPAFTKCCIMALSNLELEVRWDVDNECYQIITKTFVDNFKNAQWIHWSSSFFAATEFVFKTSKQPIKLVSDMTQKILAVFSDKSSSLQCTRVLSMVQAIAARLYVFMDIDFYGKLQDGRKKSKKNGKKTGRKSLSESRRNASLNVSVTMNDADQSGLTGAVADESDAELIISLMENEIMAQEHFLGSFLPFTVHVLKNNKEFPCSRLQQQATVSLISLMLLSNPVFDEYIPLIFTILERSPDELQRQCIVTYIPDLCKSFPNSFDPWTAKVYEILKRERSFNVRRKCILILSDLIMHDQIKVKGTISDVACCLLDSHTDIVRMTESLFRQLAAKNNSLYNVLPDIISRLSDEQFGVEQADFNKIASFLFKQLSKDKKLENFVEKLCGRFRSTTTDVQSRNLAFCLKQIPYTERSLRKLIDNVSCYADKLIDDEVWNAFTDICVQTAKGAKAELKLVVTELENCLDEARNTSGEGKENNDEAEGRPSRTTMGSQRTTMSIQGRKTGSNTSATGRRTTKATGKTPKRSGQKKNVANLMDSDSEDEVEQPDSDDEVVTEKRPNRQLKRGGNVDGTPVATRTSKRTRR